MTDPSDGPALPTESVWSYPRPPRLEAITAEIRIVFAGREIAATRSALRVLETSHPPVYYLPRSAFSCELLRSARTSVCEWKGRATYLSLRVGDSLARDAAWTYEHPLPAFARLRDHVAVYPGTMEACFVGGVRVAPQPGDFYGGWITPNIVGPFKGGPGTAGW